MGSEYKNLMENKLIEPGKEIWVKKFVTHDRIYIKNASDDELKAVKDFLNKGSWDNAEILQVAGEKFVLVKKRLAEFNVSRLVDSRLVVLILAIVFYFAITDLFGTLNFDPACKIVEKSVWALLQ